MQRRWILGDNLLILWLSKMEPRGIGTVIRGFRSKRYPSQSTISPPPLFLRSEGEYGVGAGHVPYVAQLKPGVLQILHEEGSNDPEKYFVAGGYALTHPDSSTVRL